MPDSNSIEAAQALYGAVAGRKTMLAEDAAVVLDALAAGAGPVLAELPWGETKEGERHERHQLVLTRLEGDRLHFVNALKSGLPPGTAIEGPEAGPPRRVEKGGEESMALPTFVALFANGGKAMLPEATP